MAEENDIRRELSEWESPISGLNRKAPFSVDASYLDALPEQLNAFARSNTGNESEAIKNRRISIAFWAKGIAATLLLAVSLYAGQKWLRPADPEQRISKELRDVDVSSIEEYLDQCGIDPTKFSTSSDLPDETAEALAALEPADIRTYLNQYPSAETQIK